MLKANRNKTKPRIGFKLLNDAGEFRLGAILDYEVSEESEEDTGNWILSFTFYEDDMKDLDDCKDNMCDTFATIADHELYSTMFGHFVEESAITNMFSAAAECLKDQLSSLADSGEEYKVILLVYLKHLLASKMVRKYLPLFLVTTSSRSLRTNRYTYSDNL